MRLVVTPPSSSRDNSDCAQIYVAADVNYSISERPVADGFATLGVRSRGEETCTLSLSGRFSSEWHVIVTDNVTGVSVDLTQSDYQFTTSKDDAAGRFSVEFRLSNNSGIDSVISDFGAESDVTVTAINGVSCLHRSCSRHQCARPRHLCHLERQGFAQGNSQIIKETHYYDEYKTIIETFLDDDVLALCPDTAHYGAVSDGCDGLPLR